MTFRQPAFFHVHGAKSSGRSQAGDKSEET
jgi:hypothetical protein